MPDLVVRIKKKNDGSAALSCERADGSVTWQRQDGHLGQFFPLHDLTHFAVETVLGFREAFYGLVALGWDIATFAEPGASRRMTEEALLAELIVGLFDLERTSGVASSATEFNEKIEAYFRDRALPVPSRKITETEITAVRARRGELFTRWHSLPAGETLELRFR